jgi:hypothetical protein
MYCRMMLIAMIAAVMDLSPTLKLTGQSAACQGKIGE